MDNLFSMREEEQEGEGEKRRFFLFLGVGESGIGICQRENKKNLCRGQKLSEYR